MKLRFLSVLFGSIALLMNPAFGCSSPSSESVWTFSEADMRVAVAGKYVGKHGNKSEIVTLTLDEARASGSSSTQSLTGPRLQCGTRTFIQPAVAANCASTTSMTLAGDISTSGGTMSGAVISGYFHVYTEDLALGALELAFADGTTMTASFDNGQFVDWKLTPVGENAELVTMERQ